MSAATHLSTRKHQMEAARTVLRPYWAASEAGGIWLLGALGDNEKNLAAFAQLFPHFPAIDADTDTKWFSLVDLLVDLCIEFFTNAELPIGIYALNNYHIDYAENLPIQPGDWRGPPIYVPSEDEHHFFFMKEHQLLLRKMNIREYYCNIEIMDCKRPYGDNTYFYADMADALSEPIRVMHRETQLFLRRHRPGIAGCMARCCSLSRHSGSLQNIRRNSCVVFVQKAMRPAFSVGAGCASRHSEDRQIG